MQEIDPSFNEKDVGFSRFSKFVIEAAHRGLVTVTKLDNGQYELALGPDVLGAAAQPVLGSAGSREQEAAPARERRPGGEGRGRRGGGGGFSLGEAFGLLKQALGRLSAGDGSVSADQVRDAMIAIKGGEAGALEPERFPKLLRQAHDAEIIDLSKVEDGGYAVKLRAVAAPQVGQDVAPQDTELPAAEESEVAPPAQADAAPLGAVPVRSARFRRGSRGPRLAPPGAATIGVVEVDPNFKPRIELVSAKPAGVEPIGAGSAPSSGRGTGSRDGGRSERAGGGGGGGSGRGGEGRSRSGGGRSESSGRERGDREPGERGRGRRGGRGRGGRRSSEPAAGGGGFEGTEARETPVAASSAPPAPRPPPPPPPRPAPAEGDGESFWSKVKRGLTGGE